ncbi:MAG: NAD-dependent epimerase/dehydratase family protein [Prosthecobacter sp.]|uniref:NAD-dependent epimerase/dehydratase family protein n=1 Tax=Prosthecobacter sp. TaxID=1965333 RepID=UPI003900E195
MVEIAGKVLITGGLGYLGRRLADHLRQSGLQVLQLTRRAEQDLGVVHFRGDWAAEGPCLLEGVTQIIHLSCPDEKQAAADPVTMTHEAFSFTYGLLQAAARARVRHVLLASTIHVYGRAMQDQVTEETLPRPVHPYGIIKRLMEDQVIAACAGGNMTATILRLANGFGAPAQPDMTRWSLIINDLCRQAVENNRLELRSDPRLLRNFITLEDICHAIEHCLRNPAPDDFRLMNIGSSRSHSLGEMAELVQERCAQVLGTRPELHAPAKHSGPIPALDYDCAKMRAQGITLRENFPGEIDLTLQACARWFNSGATHPTL